MKHDQSMRVPSEPSVRTESPFVRFIHPILTYWANFLRLARSSRDVDLRKDECMATSPEIPTDDEVLDALRASDGGLTPSALMQALEIDHTPENIIRAIQRVLDRNKVRLSDGAKLIPTEIDELALA